MTAPPGHAPAPKPTGGVVSATAANCAARAIRRAGFDPTPGNVRMVLRAQRDRGEIPETEDAYWDRLVRELPLGLRRPRKVAARGWAVRSA